MLVAVATITTVVAAPVTRVLTTAVAALLSIATPLGPSLRTTFSPLLPIPRNSRRTCSGPSWWSDTITRRDRAVCRRDRTIADRPVIGTATLPPTPTLALAFAQTTLTGRAVALVRFAPLRAGIARGIVLAFAKRLPTVASS